jgi:hypothetical protein
MPATREIRRDTSYAELKNHLHARLVGILAGKFLDGLPPVEFRLVVERLVDTENPLLNRMERERLICDVLADAFGFGPLEHFFNDDRVTEVLVVAPDRIQVRRCDRLELATSWEWFRDAEQVQLIIDRLASRAGLAVPVANFHFETTLPNGYYMLVLPPPEQDQAPLLFLWRDPPDPVLQPSRHSQRILVHLVKALHESGVADIRQMSAEALREAAVAATRQYDDAQQLHLDDGQKGELVNEVLAGMPGQERD